MVFLLTAVRCLLTSLGTIAGAVVRGLELIHLHARLTVATSVLDAVILVPTLLLGGGLRAALLALIASAACALLAWGVLLARIGALRLAFARDDVLLLARGGLGFVAFDLALKLQPYVDASFLERLSTPAAIGWYGASNRLMGTLLLPATTLNFAIYPSMARLWATDRDAFAKLTRLGLRAVLLFGAMAAVGTICFADVAIGLIYGREGYGPAAQNLMALAAFIALVYLTLILGCAIVAAQRQLAWAGVQALCIPISLLLDPVLIEYFQRRVGNGGLGVCCTVGIAEVLMVAGALALLPQGVLERSLWGDLRRALLSGAAMGAVALLLRPWPPLAIPLSMAAYAGAQWAQGGLDAELLAQVRGIVARKLGRGPAASPQSQ
jgi:O-antigen/teichoic acid export membrane protein